MSGTSMSGARLPFDTALRLAFDLLQAGAQTARTQALEAEKRAALAVGLLAAVEAIDRACPGLKQDIAAALAEGGR